MKVHIYDWAVPGHWTLCRRRVGDFAQWITYFNQRKSTCKNCQRAWKRKRKRKK